MALLPFFDVSGIVEQWNQTGALLDCVVPLRVGSWASTTAKYRSGHGSDAYKVGRGAARDHKHTRVHSLLSPALSTLPYTDGLGHNAPPSPLLTALSRIRFLGHVSCHRPYLLVLPRAKSPGHVSQRRVNHAG